MEQRTQETRKDLPFVSIIVPVYKVEKYIDRCIQSIIKQTYKNIEIILVDDGSPDKCGEICDEYANKNPIINVIHQKNAGQAVARNVGANKAKGEFIAFIDSDDYVEEDYIEYLIWLQQKYQTDISIGGFNYLYEEEKPEARKSEKETDAVLSVTDALIKINYNQGCGATAWAKLIRKDLVLQHPFPEGRIYEDLATIYKIIAESNEVAYGNRIIYHWVQHTGSTMRSAFDNNQMFGMDAASEQVEFMRQYFPDALKSAQYRHTAKAVELITLLFNSNGNKKVFQYLRKQMLIYADNVLKDSKAKITMKIRIISIKLGYYPAKVMICIHERAKKAIISNK